MAFHRADAGQSGAAFPAGIKIPALQTNSLQRKVVAAGLVRNTKLFAGVTPFDPMGRNLPATGAMLREKVSELMAQRALHFGGGDLISFD